MMKQIYITLVFLLVVLSNLVAEGRFEFTPQAKKAYEKAMSLRFVEANYVIEDIKQRDPNNLIVYQIENYIDLLTVFINEDKKEFDRLKKNKGKRLDAIKNGDKSSPYYLYTQAEIKLHWALARLKFEEYVTAFTEVRSAYKLLNKNAKKFPDFVANKKSLGILHALVGTIPDQYKWGVKLLGGMEGTIEQGRREIEEVINYSKTNDFIFEEETMVLYAFLMLHLKNKDKDAWQIINSDKLDPKRNPLACFALANVAIWVGRNDQAIEILQDRPKSVIYEKFHYLDYMLGVAKLYRQDADADVYLKKYVNNFKGQNCIKEAYQKLAWFDLMNGNLDGYYYNMELCKTKGKAIADGDKTALKEARSGQVPNPILTKARMLFDGGYNQKAYELLKKSSNDFTRKRDQLELNYRLGRIAHRMGKTNEALEYYQKTIDKGRHESYYFACNSALQMGIIYEQRNYRANAKAAFRNCLSIKPDEYKSSLHGKAKAGLNRLKN